MEYLIKQSRRVRFSNQENAQGPGSSKERTTLQKAPSLREEKKRPQNWFGRQMNPDYDSAEVEQAAAVAAATYAVISVTDSTISDKKNLDRRPQPSFTSIKSRKEDTKVSSPQPDTTKLDDTTVSKPHEVSSGKDWKINSEIQELEKEPEAAALPERTSLKVASPSPSTTRIPTFTDKPIKKVPTFADDQLNRRKEIQPSESVRMKPDPAPPIKFPKSDFPTSPKPALSPAKMDRQASTVPGKRVGLGGSEADSWERTELANIKNRYEEVEARIVSWENEKKTKSRRRLDKKESELERKRLKALEQFRSEIDDINQIAEGARSKAKESRIYDELKVKEKANTFRKTGKLPTTCSCF